MYNDMTFWKEQRNSNNELLNQLYSETEKETKEAVSLWERVFGKRG